MIYAIILISLLLASYTDIKTGKIPIALFPFTAIIVTIMRVCEHTFAPLPMLFGGVVMFALFFIMALVAKGGGADAIMFGCLGYMLGLADGLLIAIVAESCYAVYVLCVCVKKKDKSYIKKCYPLAPFAAVGYTILIGVKIWQKTI